MLKKIKKNDEVIIIAGKEKGKAGKVLSINQKNQTVLIDKLNIVKKHKKPTQNNTEGGILEKESPIHISNVALKEKGKDGKATKIGIKIDEKGKKIRISKKTGKEF